MTIPERIKQARIDAGLTQQQLGEACGYPPNTASITARRWESGTRPVPLDKLRIVARTLKLKLDDLIP